MLFSGNDIVVVSAHYTFSSMCSLPKDQELALPSPKAQSYVLSLALQTRRPKPGRQAEVMGSVRKRLSTRHYPPGATPGRQGAQPTLLGARPASHMD